MKRGFIDEFRKFISGGNVMDMSVGVVVGGSFGAIISSLVNDVVGPIIGMITGGIDFGNLSITVGNASLRIGSFIQSLINVLITAAVLFTVIKAINKVKDLKGKPAEEKAPTVKICPFCFTEIDVRATRCPHCTSELK